MTTAVHQRAETAAAWLKRHGALEPAGAVVLGSGWSVLADALEVEREWDYRSVPGIPATTTPGHPGRVLSGHWRGVPCVVLAGRWHVYEGFSFDEAALPGALADALGCRWLLSTNAAGGIAEGLEVGDLVSVSDDIAFLSAYSTGAEQREPGTKTTGYSRRLREALADAGRAERVRLKEGVLAMAPGPCYETPAEITYLRTAGACVVSMSTVPESRWARTHGVEALAISCVTNLVPSRPSMRLTHEEVLAVLRRASGTALRLIEGWFEHESVRLAYAGEDDGLA